MTREELTDLALAMKAKGDECTKVYAELDEATQRNNDAAQALVDANARYVKVQYELGAMTARLMAFWVEGLMNS